MSTHRRSAFTLVELLVVIGIIALLVSILLPALNRARQHANLIDCQARLRQMGQATHIYAANNKDLVPWSFLYHNSDVLASVPDPHGEQWWKWHYTLSQVMGVDEWWGLETPNTDDDFWKRNHPVFIDKDAVEESVQEDGTPGGAVPWGWRTDYTANPRVFSPRDDALADYYPTGGVVKKPEQITQRSIGTFNNPTEVMAVWDSPQWGTHGNSAFDYAHSMGGWQWFWGTFFISPPAPPMNQWVNDDGMYDRAIQPGGAGGADNVTLQKIYNRDYPLGKPWGAAPNGVPDWPSMFRFRHMNNTTLNALFVDGHVESRKVGEVKLKEVCTNYK
jgi:prepilin-type N-terminal cleavage/methylation domain-containing protein/prepilin-type processing-associated H-X9-DG protein